MTSAQEMLSLPVRVVDVNGQPVAGAVVIPWALRSSQGHGQWRVDGYGNSEPPTLTTDADGKVEVPYPRYAMATERVQTTEVTLSVDHPDFAYISYEGVNVPREVTTPHQTTLELGGSVEIVPIEEGRPAKLEALYAMWSDGRSWKPGVTPTITEDGVLQIPRMPAGKGQILLVRLNGDRATRFSPIIDVDLKSGDAVRERVELRPAVRIEGSVSDVVPRPVLNGRLSVRVVPRRHGETVRWMTWVPIKEDGTFVIDGWPAGEAAQAIALCDGYIAESGEAPEVVEGKVSDPDPFQRAQVFSPEQQVKPILIRMKPMVHCVVEAVDAQGAPIAGVEVESYPNIGWWNYGSQIYCTKLVRGEELLIKRDFMAAVDDVYPFPFRAITDANGCAELYLPTGSEDLYAEHDDYELPIIRGRREHEVTLVAGQPNHARLVLQPKGTEHLGEWDKLAGVLFGCTGEECRRLLADPGFLDKITVVRKLLDEADDPTAPLVLSKAYTDVAAAFGELEDQEEAEKWRRKAAEQAAKLEAENREEDTTSDE